MTIEEALKEFGSGRQVCIALGISDRNWTRWVREDLIPLKHQQKLSELKPKLKMMDSITYQEKQQNKGKKEISIDVNYGFPSKEQFKEMAKLCLKDKKKFTIDDLSDAIEAAFIAGWNKKEKQLKKE
jgi:hypothetical protein